MSNPYHDKRGRFTGPGGHAHGPGNPGGASVPTYGKGHGSSMLMVTNKKTGGTYTMQNLSHEKKGRIQEAMNRQLNDSSNHGSPGTRRF